jgi:hypothetical protein
MKIPPWDFPLENKLVQKLDIMIDRCSDKRAKRDAVLIVEGAEGEGKTTCSIAVAFYVSKKLNRKFTHKNVFFDVVDMIKFLQDKDEQIAIWDEPALQALSTDFASKTVKNLTRLLMMVRKKRHFIIINITHFNKFNDYVICDRPLGMIHVYSRKGIQSGRFFFIRKKHLWNLWLDWRHKKLKSYKKYCAMGGKIWGTFPDVLSEYYANNVLEDFDINAYEKNKDNAIGSIGKITQEEENKDELKILKQKIGALKPPIKTKKELAKLLGYNRETLRLWANCDTIDSLKAKVQALKVTKEGVDDVDDDDSNIDDENE